jgi:GNAT superfamily N-acetyltransferase
VSAGLTIARTSLADPVARALIARLDAELSARYPEEGATHFRLDAEEVDPGQGGFLVARLDGAPVGCGAVRRLDGDAAEIKRMYTAPEARGRGVARALLAELEAVARGLGVARLLLETGTRQAEAIGLYEGAGFTRIPAYGEYVGSPLSVCYGKPL